MRFFERAPTLRLAGFAHEASNGRFSYVFKPGRTSIEYRSVMDKGVPALEMSITSGEPKPLVVRFLDPVTADAGGRKTEPGGLHTREQCHMILRSLGRFYRQLTHLAGPMDPARKAAFDHGWRESIADLAAQVDPRMLPPDGVDGLFETSKRYDSFRSHRHFPLRTNSVVTQYQPGDVLPPGESRSISTGGFYEQFVAVEAGVVDERARLAFRRGQCHAYAYADHEMTGSRIHGIREKGSPSFGHVLVWDEQRQLFRDINGECSRGEALARCELSEETGEIVELTESELQRVMNPVADTSAPFFQEATLDLARSVVPVVLRSIGAVRQAECAERAIAASLPGLQDPHVAGVSDVDERPQGLAATRTAPSSNPSTEPVLEHTFRNGEVRTADIDESDLGEVGAPDPTQFSDPTLLDEAASPDVLDFESGTPAVGVSSTQNDEGTPENVAKVIKPPRRAPLRLTSPAAESTYGRHIRQAAPSVLGSTDPEVARQQQESVDIDSGDTVADVAEPIADQSNHGQSSGMNLQI